VLAQDRRDPPTYTRRVVGNRLNESANHSFETGRAIGVVMLAVGLFLAAADTLELTSFRHLAAGETRYQPPWTWPALVVGAALCIAGAVVALGAWVRQRRGRR
jgi:hypothetical protein